MKYTVNNGLDKPIIIEADSVDVNEGHLVLSTKFEIVAVFVPGNWLAVMANTPTKDGGNHG